MSKQMKYFLTLAGLIIIGSFLAFLYGCIDGLARFSGRIDPTFEPWVFWVLFGFVGTILLWMVGSTLLRPRPLLVHANPSEAELARFRARLLARLKRNRVLRDEEVVINDDADLPAALAVLREKADAEIRATARRVFIGTAVSQNGKLDVLVVLYLVSRMSWRVAKLYNQRPHYRELINLYANVAITSFVAGSIEDLGVEEHVTKLMAPLASGSALGAVPGAQAIAGTITNSVLTGSTNCLLALRCGILARDFMSLNLDAKGSMRRNATLEASKIFVSMSAETVTFVTKALVKGTRDAVKTGSARSARKVADTVAGTAEAVGSGARKVGRGTRDTVRGVGRSVRGAADVVAGGAKSVSYGVKEATGVVTGGARKVGHEVKATARTVQRETAKSVDSVLNAAVKVAGSVRFKRREDDGKTESTRREDDSPVKKKSKTKKPFGWFKGMVKKKR